MLEIKEELQKAISEIKKKKAKRVLVQLPEGLKGKTIEIVREIESQTKAQIFVLVEPCFGACDIAEEKAKILGAELIIHFGHTKMLNSKIPIIYLPLKYKIEGKKSAEVLEKYLKERNLKKIALCSAIQYLNAMNSIAEELEKKGIKVFVGKGDERIAEKGQVLGCNFSSVKDVEKNAEAVVFVGDGLFHPLGIAFETEKEVIAFNPLSREIKEMKEEKEKFLRKRFGAIAKAKSAESFGILVSTKKGQNRIEKAIELKEKIEKKGKKAFILAFDLLKPEYLLGVEVDAFVNTACPRIAVDDFSQFNKPVLNEKELKEALK